MLQVRFDNGYYTHSGGKKSNQLTRRGQKANQFGRGQLRLSSKYHFVAKTILFFSPCGSLLNYKTLPNLPMLFTKKLIYIRTIVLLVSDGTELHSTYS